VGEGVTRDRPLPTGGALTPELIADIREALDTARENASHHEHNAHAIGRGRNLALTITHLEDALMRAKLALGISSL